MPYITSVEKIGFERGQQENTAALASKMFEEGANLEFVRKVTGLTLKKLRQIQADLQVHPIDGASSD
jgi:hypothetical protein